MKVQEGLSHMGKRRSFIQYRPTFIRKRHLHPLIFESSSPSSKLELVLEEGERVLSVALMLINGKLSSLLFA